MLVPTSQIRDWRDLQDKAAQLFREMGYVVLSPHIVPLVRGEKEVDVFVSDQRTSVPHVILVECKHWLARVPKETVHSMRTVVQDSGANTGIIVSRAGFQSGAGEAAVGSNVQLKTWDELQVAYGHEWYLRQKELLAPYEAGLDRLQRDYLDQDAASRTIINWMRFDAMGRTEEILVLLAEARVFMLAMRGGPRSYDQPGPIEVLVDDDFPGAVPDRHGLPVIKLDDVRSWFNWTREGARSVLDRCKRLSTETFDAFEQLHPADSDRAFAKATQESLEETPLRVMRDIVGDNEYDRLLTLLRDPQRRS